MKRPSLRPHNRSGFTLIELLLVIAIIAILAAIVIIAINPARQIAQANNAQRRSNVVTILNGISQYMVDNRGSVPASVSSTQKEICKTGTSNANCNPGVDMSVLTTNQLYLSSTPIDPLADEAATGTGYWVSKTASSNPRITVSAPNAENAESIIVTR